MFGVVYPGKSHIRTFETKRSSEQTFQPERTSVRSSAKLCRSYCLLRNVWTVWWRNTEVLWRQSFKTPLNIRYSTSNIHKPRIIHYIHYIDYVMSLYKTPNLSLLCTHTHPKPLHDSQCLSLSLALPFVWAPTDLNHTQAWITFMSWSGSFAALINTPARPNLHP